MSLVFLPGQSRFFLWGERHLTSALTAEAKRGSPCEVDLVTPTQRTRVTGTALPLLDTVAVLLEFRLAGGQVGARALNSMRLEKSYPSWGRELTAENTAFESGLQAPSSEVYLHEMPGGQVTNLRAQARSMGLEERWPGIRDRLCEPGPVLRSHIHVYVDGERAGAFSGQARHARTRSRRPRLWSRAAPPC